MPQRHFTRTGTAARILCVRVAHWHGAAWVRIEGKDYILDREHASECIREIYERESNFEFLNENGDCLSEVEVNFDFESTAWGTDFLMSGTDIFAKTATARSSGWLSAVLEDARIKNKIEASDF